MASETAGAAHAEDAALARLARLIEPGSLLEATPECLVVARADGRIIFANHLVEALTGFPSSELVGRQVELLLPADLVHGEPGTRIETICRRRGGETMPVEVHLGAIDGPEKLLVVTLRDATELQAGREARQDVETRYRNLIEQTPAITYTWTWEHGEHGVPYVSPQIEDILGYTPAEWMADPEGWYAWVHPDDLARQRAEVDRCEVSGEAYAMEYRMVRKDGRVIWVSEAWRVVDDDGHGHRAFQGLVYDITERREAEEALRRRSVRLDATLEIQRAIAAADLDLGSVMRLVCERTQELTHADAATVLLLDGDAFVYRAATGFIEARLGGRVPLEGTLTGWAFANDRPTICNDTLEDPRVGPLAIAHQIRSMVVVPLRHGDLVAQLQVQSQEPHAFTDDDVNTLELLSVFLSSALSHAAEFEAKRDQLEAEAKHRLLIEQISAITYTWTWRGIDYIVAYVSPQIEAVLGYTREEWSADPTAWYDWVHPDDRGTVIAENKRCESTAEPYSMEYRMIRKDGREIWVSDKWVVVEDAEGDHRSFQGLVVDITERKRAEAALHAQTERMSRIIETQRDVAVAELDLTAVMDVICARTQELTNGGSAAVLLAEGDGFVLRAATGFMGEDLGMRVPMEGSLTGWVHRHGAPTVCDDTLTDPRASELARDRGIRSMVLVPLRHGDIAVGQLQVLSRRPGAFTEEDQSTLELLSVVLSSALSHAAEFEAKRDQVEALALFESVYQGAPIGVTLVSPEGRNVESNPAFQAMLGYTGEELAELTIRDYTHPDDVDKNVELFQEMMAGDREFYRMEKRYFRKDGKIVWGQVAAALHRGADGRPKYAISMVENITDRKLAEERVAFLAYHDKLTGLPNRTLFEEMLEKALARAARHDLGVGVLFLDLDNFKLVNDSLGHNAGDQLLVQLSGRLQRCTRETDLVARQGGDEFLVLLSDLERGPKALSGSDAGQLVAEMVANRVREALAEPFELSGTEFYASASIGISLYPDDASDAQDLLKNADTAMYLSKKNEPGSYVVFSTQDEDPVRKLSFSTRLRQAVADQNWVLHYQPIVDLGDGSVNSVEALVRWQEPNGGLLPPGEFIPLAEEMGLIEAIGDWVFEELARQHAAWQEQGLRVPISYNLSPRQTWAGHLAEKLLGKLATFDVDPHDITIEITESTAMSDPDRTQRLLTELHAWGFTLAIDDFGTGYSSLARLKHMPVDILKIDQAFVRHVEYDRDLAGMVRAMIQLAQSLGMIPLAEGIETYGEFEFLRANGCRLAQGFHFAYPVPADEIPELVRRQGGLFGPEPSHG